MIVYLVFTLIGAIGSSALPQSRQYYILPANLVQQQQLQQTPGDQNVIYLTDPIKRQGPAYVNQNGLVYSRDGINRADQPGYLESLYAYLTGQQTTQSPPQNMSPVDPVTPVQPTPPKPEPIPEEEKTTTQDPETISITESPVTAANREEGNARQEKEAMPMKLQERPAKLEELEPEAELIPETDKTPQVPQQMPHYPFPAHPAPIPYPANPGYNPGQRFYIYNGPHQYIPNSPQFGFPQIGAPQIFGQPAFRYPNAVGGFPQRFLIFGQQPAYVQPNLNPHPQGDPSIYSVNGQPDDGTSGRQVQNLQIPPQNAQTFARQVALNPRGQINSNENGINQIRQLDYNVYSEVNQQRNAAIEQQQQAHYTPQYNIPQQYSQFAIPNMQQQLSNDGSYQYSPEPVEQQPQPGKAALEFARYLQGETETDMSRFIANSKSDIVLSEDDDSVSVDADDINEKTKSDLKSNPSLSQAQPQAIAVAGKGGSARSYPLGSAVVGAEGLAVANPIATAIAGPQAYKYLKKS